MSFCALESHFQSKPAVIGEALEEPRASTVWTSVRLLVGSSMTSLCVGSSTITHSTLRFSRIGVKK